MKGHQERETWVGQPIGERVDANTILPGLDFVDVGVSGEVNGTPIAAIILVKVIDRDGDIYWLRRTSAGVSSEEAIGALEVHHQQQLHGRIATYYVDWQPEQEDDDE